MQQINGLIVSQYKIRDVNATTNCSAALPGSQCQYYNTQLLPFSLLNQTVRSCYQNYYIYVIPAETIDPANPPSLTVILSLLPCKHYFNDNLRGQGLHRILH
jgi:hypothetical protein